MTSYVPLNGILMHFTYEEKHFANIILKVSPKHRHTIGYFLQILYGVLHYHLCFLKTVGTQNY